MVLDLAAVMDVFHTADLESYVSLRKFEIPGVSDMITTLTGVGDIFSFFLRYVSCRVLYEYMLSPFLCHIPAVQNALITAYFHCWGANMYVCSTPLYSL